MPAEAHGPQTATGWLRTLYAVTAAEGVTPPSAARRYAYAVVAMHEAVVHTSPRHRSLGRQLAGLGRLPVAAQRGRVDAPLALSAAAREASRGVWGDASPGSHAVLDRRHAAVLAERAHLPSAVVTASLDHGARVGAAVAAWAATDGAAEAAAMPYTPPVGPALWAPTPPNFGRAIEPHCHRVRPMVLHAADEVVPAPPVPFDTAADSAFHDQALAVYVQSQHNTDETRGIARFWTDNPVFSGLPSGHWLHIACQAVEQRGLGLVATTEALALTSVALHDAFVNCWTWKYRWNLLRPVTYVRRHVDPTWSTWVNTPQFPEHTSGHSVASRAAATVLTGLLGDAAFDDRTLASTDGIRTPVRRFPTFRAAADEAAQSRLYGGIHYPWGIEAGKAQGDEIGALVLARVRSRT